MLLRRQAQVPHEHSIGNEEAVEDVPYYIHYSGKRSRLLLFDENMVPEPLDFQDTAGSLFPFESPINCQQVVFLKCNGCTGQIEDIYIYIFICGIYLVLVSAMALPIK